MRLRGPAVAVLFLALAVLAVPAAAQDAGGVLVEVDADSVEAGSSTTLTVTATSGGEPVPNASVRVTGTGVTANATTDASGEATVDVAPARPGTLDVTVAAGAATGSRSVAVEPVLHLTVSRSQLPLDVAKPVEATVTYEHNDEPATGATVTFSGAGTDATATVGEDGTATATVRPTEEAGTVEVSAEERGAVAASSELSVAGIYVFGLANTSKPYWTLVLVAGFLVTAVVLLNQIATDTLVLKE